MGLGFRKIVTYVGVEFKDEKNMGKLYSKGANGVKKYYDELSGKIVDFRDSYFESPQYGKKRQIEVVFDDMGETFILVLGFDNGASRSLMNCLANAVDKYPLLSLAEIKVVPNVNKNKTKNKTYLGMYIFVNNEYCPWKYSKDDLPEVRKVIEVVKGQSVPIIEGKAESEAFYEKNCFEPIKAVLGHKKTSTEVVNCPPESAIDTVEDDGDVPF